MAKRKYSAIVFDLGNVLLPFNHGIMVNKLNEIKPELGNRFYKYYVDNYYVHRNFEKGLLSEEEFLKIMVDVCEHTISEKEFCEIFSDVFSVNDDVVSLLPRLKQNYKLLLLSNTNSIHREYGYKHYEFLNYFDKLILSYEVKSYKPEPEIYKAAEKFSKYPSEEHIFIDDISEYVNGAKSLGWDGIQFKNFDQLTLEFKARDILF
jgi:glucose-1-phosphatase